MKALNNLAEKALGTLEQITFKIGNVETKPSKTGNVGFKATSDSGKVITFWSSNMDRVVEALDDETFRVIAGTQIAEDGALIPRDSSSNGFWA